MVVSQVTSDWPSLVVNYESRVVCRCSPGSLGDDPAMDDLTRFCCLNTSCKDHGLRAGDNLAVAYREAGRTAEAITMQEQTVAARDRVLGRDHPDTLESRGNLAGAYRDAGRTAEAKNKNVHP